MKLKVASAALFSRLTSQPLGRDENVAIVEVLPVPLLPIPIGYWDWVLATFSHWRQSLRSPPLSASA